MANDPEVKMSPLCQTIERDGLSVNVEISQSPDGGWILEVVDKFNNSTVWEDRFKTDQDALDEVMDTIAQEGIQCLVGTESWQPN